MEGTRITSDLLKGQKKKKSLKSKASSMSPPWLVDSGSDPSDKADRQGGR